MFSIADNLESVRQRIQKAAIAVHRDPSTVSLLAVSKKKPAEAVQVAYRAGQKHFGENYLQEALEKQAQLEEQQDITWHFIGPIQSNKTRDIANHFDWVHSVDRLKIIKRLSEQRDPNRPPINVCLQVNINEEDSKSGVLPEEIETLAHAADQAEGLCLRGLMAIPAPHQSEAALADTFGRLEGLFAQLARRYNSVDMLSLGMSADLEQAIAAGSTMVRIGTDIFGARDS